MTKSELTQKLAQKYDISTKHAKLIVDAIFDSMTEALASGDKVILRGFGAFSMKVSRERTGRNPQTGQEIHVAPRKHIVFKTGRTLHERLNPSDKA